MKIIAKSSLVSFIYKAFVLVESVLIPRSSTRVKTSIFEYKHLSRKCINDKLSLIRDNNLYGIEEVITKFIGSNINKVFFEHGIVFGNLVTNNTKDTFAKKVVTYGKYRKCILEGMIAKEVITIGPFIHYASHILTESEYVEQKSILGRVLLVFPTHSIKSVESEYDIEAFCNEVAEKSSNFDNVVVCLYWKDIELGKDILYIKKGFKVVTAGYYNDTNFLNRLKSIIELSDMVIANEIGTFLGYCIFLGKPVYLFNQEIKHKGLGIASQIELKQRTDSELDNYLDLRQKFFEYFGFFIEKITDEQYEICNNIWGFDQIRDKDELKSMLI